MDRERFSRQIVLPEVGEEGQERLGRSNVALVGVGGLGCPAAIALASAGVGGLLLIDPDRVELSNLPRQWLFREADLGRPKVEAAADAVCGLAPPGLRLGLAHAALDSANALTLLEGCDLVIDGSDRFASRYAVSAAAATLGIPALLGAVQGFTGQLIAQPASGSPCYRCAFPDPPDPAFAPPCSEVGILAPIPATIAQIASLRALELLLGRRRGGELLRFDFRAGRCTTLQLGADPACPGCGRSSARRPPVDLLPGAPIEISTDELERWLVEKPELLLVDVRTQIERVAGIIDGDRHFPLKELDKRIEKIELTGPVVVYCAVGQRSMIAAGALRRAGIEAWSLRGGFRGWKARRRGPRDEATRPAG